jgi:hypothetical protein
LFASLKFFFSSFPSLGHKEIARFLTNHRDCRDRLFISNDTIEAGSFGVLQSGCFVNFPEYFLNAFIRGTSPILGRPHLKHYGHADTFQSVGSAYLSGSELEPYRDLWHSTNQAMLDKTNR